MARNRDISKLLSTSNGKIAGANLDVSFENITDTGTEGTKVASGTTAQRGSTAGQFRFNSDTGKFEGRNATNFISIDATPVVSSVNASNITQKQIDDGFDLVITGQNFSSGDVVKFVGNDNSELVSPTVTINSATQITARVNSSIDATKEPFKVTVTSSGGLSGNLGSAFNIDARPVWSTASGNIANIKDDATGTHATVAATDPEGDAITYSETGGTVLSGQNFSLDANSGAITGDPTNVLASTTHNFTLRATSGTNTTDRNFNIVVTPADFGLRYLVVAGGGGGGSNTGNYENGGGGGGGGFRTATGFTVAHGTAYTVTVGGGGTDYGHGQNSVFSTITSIGGGGGGGSSPITADNGGSGGGGSAWGSGGAIAYGTYSGSAGGGIYDSSPRQGYDGGAGTTGVPTTGGGGGGGGAGAVGSNGSGNYGGAGGVGLASDITGSSVYYAGGGGAGGGSGAGSGGNGGGASGSTSGSGGNGTANTGGGGGGTRNGTGGSGGSGIVILRYPSTKTLTVGAGLTSSTVVVGSDKVTSFTSGTGTVQF